MVIGGEIPETLLDGLCKALERKERGSVRHSKGVAAFAVALAEALKLAADDVQIIRHGALLHEIGKLATPDAVLHKPAKLTQEEMSIFREYCYRGYEIVRQISSVRDSRDRLFPQGEV